MREMFAALALGFIAVALPVDAAPPPNDDGANAMTITGETGATTGTLLDSTREEAEPGFGCSPDSPGGSIWYAWHAPRDVAAIFRVGTAHGASPGVDLLVFEDVLLPPIGISSRVFTRTGSRVIFDAVADHIYYISVVDCGAAGDATNLNWTFSGAGPSNDSFDSPEELIGSQGRTPGDNTTATVEADEPAIPTEGPGDSGGQSLWYQWTAPESGLWAFTTDGVVQGGSGYPLDSILAVYTGDTFAGLQLVASDDDYFSEEALFRFSQVIFSAEVDETYRIVVTGYNEKTSAFFLNWAPVPRNDAFDGADELDGSVGSVTESNIGASVENGEPDAGDWSTFKSLDRTIWYRWTAPATGQWTFDTLGSNFNSSLGVYSGEGFNNLNHIARSNDASPIPADCEHAVFTSSATFYAVVGNSYAIVLGGGESGNTGMPISQSRGGDAMLSWRPTPVNDDFAAAESIAGSNGSVSFSTIGASSDVALRPEVSDDGASVWFRWQAPESGMFTFDTLANPQRVTLLVLTGAPGSFAGVAYASSQCTLPGHPNFVTFAAAGGEFYSIRISTYFDEWGPVTLNWGPPEPATTTTLPPTACGDANDSGDITATDALMILKAAVGGDECDEQPCVCDVAGGGSIAASDALAALRIAVGQSIEPACSC